MIERLQKFATQFYWLKPLLLVLAALSLATALIILLSSSAMSDDVLLIPAIVLFSWCCVTYSVLNLFIAVPPKANKDTPLLSRIGRFIIRNFYYFLALCTVLLSFALLLVSYQLVSAWLRAY